MDHLRFTNEQHDSRLRAEGINPEGRIGASWNTQALARRGYLTDKKIAEYQKKGFYSAEYRSARKKLMEQKAKRKGNFVERDGSLVYSPM